MRKKRDFAAISPRANVLLNIMFIIYTAMCIIPFLLVVGISVSDENTLLTYGYHIIPKNFSGTAYRFVTGKSMSLLRSYGITIFTTVVGTLLCVIITAMFAYPISRKDFKYRNFFSFIVFFTMFYYGFNRRHAQDGVAFSDDLLHWEKYAEPILKNGTAEADLDYCHAHKPSVLRKDGELYHFYCAVRHSRLGDPAENLWNEFRCITVAASKPFPQRQRYF